MDNGNLRITGNELKYIKEVLATEFRSSKGSVMMERFEKAFSNKFESQFAISFVNGTATMHAVLEAIGVGIGDEVIVPPLTMSSTTVAVMQCGGTPVFADVCEDTFLIDPKSIEQCITERTKAIITVSLYGLVPKMDEIMKIAKRYDLFVLEDNAQCVRGKYKGKIAGTFGHAASFSLQSSKHLTCGEGGVVTTNDKLLAENIRKVCSLGYAGVGAEKGKISKKEIQDPAYSRHVMMGWNYRMPELCSAVALAQLERLDTLVEARVKAAEYYLGVLRDCPWLIPQYVDEDRECSYWTLAVIIQHPKVTWHQFRDKFLDLGGDGIYAAWKLTYLEPMFEHRNLLGRENNLTRNNYGKGLCPIAEDLQPRLLQFKTNFWNSIDAEKQADILKKTIICLKD